MIVNVIWPARDPKFLNRGYADCAFLEQIMDRTIWTPQNPLEFLHHEVRDDFPDVEGAVVVFNGRANSADADWLIGEINKLVWSLVIITGDEEWDFPWERLPESWHRKVWVMAPWPMHADLSYRLPGGWYWNTREELAPHAELAEHRPLDFFFAGQVTHIRRKDCVRELVGRPGGKVIRTEGFLQGVESDEYMRFLASAKVVPCPSGPVTVDTSRPLSAMEAGCVPIVDTRKPLDPQFDYWTLVFGDGWPMPYVYEWNELPRALDDILADWPNQSAKVFSWWQQWKRQTARRLDADIRELDPRVQLRSEPDDRITVVITSSPIVSHPDTTILEQVIESVRERLPTAEIIVVMDGVRPEQERLRADYQTYIQRVLWKCNFEWHNVLPVVMPQWGHQANSTRYALTFVETDVMLFLEHDTPIVGDIDWAALIGTIESGYANAIRLHQDVEMHADHERVMIDHETQTINGVPLRRTMAWWQRPHLASTDFYREFLTEFFHPEARTMIEDLLYGKMWIDCVTHRHGWDKWKVWVYFPEGPDIRRSGHLDGRQQEPKFDMLFTAPKVEEIEDVIEDPE